MEEWGPAIEHSEAGLVLTVAVYVQPWDLVSRFVSMAYATGWIASRLFP